MDKVDFNGFVLVGASYKEGESYQGNNKTSCYKEENSGDGNSTAIIAIGILVVNPMITHMGYHTIRSYIGIIILNYSVNFEECIEYLGIIGIQYNNSLE